MPKNFVLSTSLIEVPGISTEATADFFPNNIPTDFALFRLVKFAHSCHSCFLTLVGRCERRER